MAVAELPWLGDALAQRQVLMAARAGFKLEDAEDPGAIGQALARGEAVVVVPGEVAFTGEALGALIEAGRRGGGDLRFGLGGESGALADRLRLGRDEPALCWLSPTRGGDVATRLIEAERATLDPRERLLPMTFVSPTGEVVRVPLTDRLALPVGHWLQLLWANLLGLGPWLWRALLSPRLPVALARLGAASLASLSVDPWRVAAQLTRRGRRCRLHPAAVVEASHLGDGVSVGAGAVVRGCVVGDGVHIEDQALVEGCALSSGVRVQRQAMVKYSVIGPGAVAGGVMQLGVLGAEASLKFNGILMDVNFGGPVRVRVGQGLAEAPFGMAGVALGRGATVATGVHVAPGRVIPPGVVVVADPAALVRVIPEGLDGLVQVHEGRLVKR